MLKNGQIIQNVCSIKLIWYTMANSWRSEFIKVCYCTWQDITVCYIVIVLVRVSNAIEVEWTWLVCWIKPLTSDHNPVTTDTNPCPGVSTVSLSYSPSHFQPNKSDSRLIINEKLLKISIFKHQELNDPLQYIC